MTTENVVNLFEDSPDAAGVDAGDPGDTGADVPTGTAVVAAPVSNGKSKKSKPGKAVGVQAKASVGSAEDVAGSDVTTVAEGADASPPQDSGNGLTEQANDELAKLAAKNSETTSTASVPDGSADAVTYGPVGEDGKPVRKEGESLYSFRQREQAWAKSTGKNQARSKGAGGKKLSAAEIKRREKEAAKAKAEKEKLRAKEKTQKQKDREKAKADAQKAKVEERKKNEEERKARVAKEKAERAAKRALAAVPKVISRENAETKQAFAEDFKQAALIDFTGKPLKMVTGKTGKTIVAPGQESMRRMKCDRGDFAAGYIMALRRLRAAKAAG